jgi:hypothetical protein
MIKAGSKKIAASRLGKERDAQDGWEEPNSDDIAKRRHAGANTRRSALCRALAAHLIRIAFQ